MNHSDYKSLDYWVSDLVIDDADVEQIYNHFLDIEKPQTASQISEIIINFRVDKERQRIDDLLSGRKLYQPKDAYEIGDELVFPALRFASGTVQSIRDGYDPSFGRYSVLAVEIDTRKREFASNLTGEHQLNIENGEGYDPFASIDLDEIKSRFGAPVTRVLLDALSKRDEFVRVGEKWFVRALMADVNVGHLHLAEAVLDMHEGGPLPPEEIIVHLDLDVGLDDDVRLFSLNWALLNDDRFDEVGPPKRVEWFLRKAEPDGVHVVPERLRYDPLDFDRAQLSPQLVALEQELDDEWSDLAAPDNVQTNILALTYPHRRAGTLPLSSRNRPLFPTGSAPRHRVILIDEQSQEQIIAWVVREGRYIFGLSKWYADHSIPVGGFITLKPGPEPNQVYIDFDRRRPKREWVRLATVEDNNLKFELERRSVGCGYDDLLIVGTDYVGAVDSLARRLDTGNRTLASLIISIFPSLAKLNPQESVHTKTLYSAINMIRRVPPGPLFSELIKHPALQPVGDHYWQYEPGRS